MIDDETAAPNVWVHLFDGEQDGFRKKIELKTTAPKRFYVWHVRDGEKIEKAKGRNRMVLQSKLATLAYELFDEIELAEERITEYRYRRMESADKAVAETPGASTT